MTVILPGITKTPGGGAILAEKLDEAIGIIESWKIRVSPHSRPKRAARLLRDISRLDAYPRDPAALTRIGNAIRIAFDFYHITRCLPSDRVEAIAEDLRRSLGGTLDDVDASESRRAQSQVLVGAVMAVAGLRPGAPALSAKKSPDYVIHVGSLPFGLEIKRPESEARLEARVHEGVTQLNEYGSRYSAVVVDVSDLLPRHVGAQSDADALTIAQETFRRLYSRTSVYLTSRQSEPAYARIAVLFVFASALVWRDQPPPVPVDAFYYYGEVFHKACSGLIVNEAQAIRDQAMRGFEVFGGQLQHFERVNR